MKSFLLKLAFSFLLLLFAWFYPQAHSYMKSGIYKPIPALSESTQEVSDLPKGANYKQIVFPDGSLLKGIIYKNQLLDGHDAILFSADADTLVCGTVTNLDYGICIVGLWKNKTSSGDERVLGKFLVTNTDKDVFSIKPGRAKTPKVQVLDYSFYECMGTTEKFVIKDLDEKSTAAYLYRKNPSPEKPLCMLATSVTKEMVDQVGWNNAWEIMRKVSETEMMFLVRYLDGAKFKGYIEFANDGGFFLRQGIYEFASGPIQQYSLFKDDQGFYSFKVEYRNKTSRDINKIELTLNGDIPETVGWWNTDAYFQNSVVNKVFYADGREFTGELVKENTDYFPGEGVLRYPGGERFTGNVAGQWVYGIPIEGTMENLECRINYEDDVRDGTTSGNWLSRYALTEDEKTEITRAASPSRKLQIARECAVVRDIEKQYSDAVAAGDKAKNKKEYDVAAEQYSSAYDLVAAAPDRYPGKDSVLRDMSNKADEALSLLRTALREQVEKDKLQLCIEKYGREYGPYVYRKELKLGMTKQMVSVIVVPEAYRRSSYSSGGHIYERWVFDADSLIGNLDLLGQAFSDSFSLLQLELSSSPQAFASSVRPDLEFRDGILVSIEH